MSSFDITPRAGRWALNRWPCVAASLGSGAVDDGAGGRPHGACPCWSASLSPASCGQRMRPMNPRTASSRSTSDQSCPMPTSIGSNCSASVMAASGLAAPRPSTLAVSTIAACIIAPLVVMRSAARWMPRCASGHRLEELARPGLPCITQDRAAGPCGQAPTAGLQRCAATANDLLGPAFAAYRGGLQLEWPIRGNDLGTVNFGSGSEAVDRRSIANFHLTFQLKRPGATFPGALVSGRG
jgi:hypothetical protein